MAKAGIIIEESHEKKLQLSYVKNDNYVSARESVALDRNINSTTEMIIIDGPSAFDYHCKNKHWNMKNRRIIELNDRKTKIGLHGKFKLDEMNVIEDIGNSTPSTITSRGELHYVDKISDEVCGHEDILLPKLPSGTILIKHNNCSNIDDLSGNLMPPAVDDETTQLNIKKIEPIYSPAKMNRNTKMRRNPVRSTKKKFDDILVRPRLLTTKRRSNNNAQHVNHVANKKQTKLSNVPYMNTRSVTKKLYNVGANHQSPTVKDEIEWREWPVHGMHDRPIYHPQVGLAVECLGSNFISLDGFSYQEVSQSSEINMTPIDPKPLRTFTHARGNRKNQYRNGRSMEDSFENCMHESLHSVLAYSAQIKDPLYKKLMSNYEVFSKQIVDSTCPKQSDVNRGMESSSLQVTKPPLNLKCIKNHAKLQKVLKRGSKNTLILLKTTDSSLPKENNCKKSASEISSTTLIPVKVTSEMDSEHIILEETSNVNELSLDDLLQDASDPAESSTMKIDDGTLITSQSSIKNEDDNDSSKDNWLQELISDTAMLYCTAIGTHQDDFVMYLNTLDPQHCINWIKSGY